MRSADPLKIAVLVAGLFIIWMLIYNSPASAHVAVKDDHLRGLVMDIRAKMKAELPVGQWRAAKRLWDAESHWNPRSSTGNCLGIPQACPGSKMESHVKPKRGTKWDSIKDPWVQWAWGDDYVHNRHGTYKKAYRFQEEHGWY